MGGQFPPDWGWSVCSGLQLKSYWFRGGQFHPDLGGQFDRILHFDGLAPVFPVVASFEDEMLNPKVDIASLAPATPLFADFE
jgi:hypothetical protein